MKYAATGPVPDAVVSRLVPVRSRRGFSATHAAVFDTSVAGAPRALVANGSLIDPVRDEKRRVGGDC